MKSKLLLAISAAVLALLPTVSHASSAAPVVVKMTSADGKDVGTISLTEKKGGVDFKLDLMNLSPGEHAIHVHQNPKCDPPTYASSGFHLNPNGKMHGMKNPDGPHDGDIPVNLKVSSDGTDKSSFVVKTLSLDPAAPNSVFANGGTSIIIHASADDMETDPGGNSGPRIACGIILAPGK
jgi:superoxide dismutase, Cu-Zn family